MPIFSWLKKTVNHIEILPGLTIAPAERRRYLKQMNAVAVRAAALEDISEFDAEIILADNAYVQDLNKRFRGLDAPTDVLSFPANDLKTPISQALSQGFVAERSEDGRRIFLGEIYISLDKAIENAAAYGNNCIEELCFLTVHGMLHLMGYDHMEEADEKMMRARQREALGRNTQEQKE